MTGHLATRLAGSSDLYQPGGRQPYHSIKLHYVARRLPDERPRVVLPEAQRGQREGNRDGDNNNYSSNNGVEGPTRRRSIEAARLRQIKNMLATLFLSQGVPMLLAGDECRRTQQGNNNAYCQDKPHVVGSIGSWSNGTPICSFQPNFDRFRRNNPTVRRSTFLDGRPPQPGELADVTWFSAEGGEMDWSAAIKRSPSYSPAPPGGGPAVLVQASTCC